MRHGRGGLHSQDLLPPDRNRANKSELLLPLIPSDTMKTHGKSHQVGSSLRNPPFCLCAELKISCYYTNKIVYICQIFHYPVALAKTKIKQNSFVSEAVLSLTIFPNLPELGPIPKI
jgi:hypothetical protein